MADSRAADARLRRILHVLPAAARDGGARLDELAADLGVEPGLLLQDLEQVTSRNLYLPPGPADDLQIELTAERIRVWTKADFTRPVKLLPREALALGLGFRALAASGAADLDVRRLDALRTRLEEHLATEPTDELQPLFEPEDGAGGGSMADADADGDPDPDPDRVPTVVFSATRDRRPLRIRYVKPGDPAPEPRTVEPWTVVRAEGRWYVMGRDPDAGDDRVRIFRMDRILAAEAVDGSFEVPDDFDPADWVDRGRLFRAADPVEVVVRYSPRIARWIREKPWAGDVAGVRETPDGALVVRHRVADTRWLVSHVLQYGPDAEVLEPGEMRERVRGVVEGLAG
ncbi:MAG TPA: WYL domain-containing protein, partial [Gemmatimonadota bacterium]|nr:WYL domain-containing protein [Gemmatimonadota bacterium]